MGEEPLRIIAKGVVVRSTDHALTGEILDFIVDIYTLIPIWSSNEFRELCQHSTHSVSACLSLENPEHHNSKS